MTELGINYRAIKQLEENAQIGGKGDVKPEDQGKNANYIDGLSIFDMEKLDKNGDGILTKGEFKEAGIYDLWDSYFGAYGEQDIDFSSDENLKDYTAKAKNIIEGSEQYDDEGNLISYQIDAKDANGAHKIITVTRTIGDDGTVTDKFDTGSTSGADGKDSVSGEEAEGPGSSDDEEDDIDDGEQDAKDDAGYYKEEELGINYEAIEQLRDYQQIGGEDNHDNPEHIDYSDGLSISDMKELDKNGDGILTKAEFENAKADSKWEDYVNAYKEHYIDFSSDENLKDYTAQAKNIIEGSKTYDSNGNLVSYQVEATDKDGNTKIINVTRTIGDDGTVTDKFEIDSTQGADGKNPVSGGEEDKPGSESGSENGDKKLTPVTSGENSPAGKTDITVDENGKLQSITNTKAGIEISKIEYNDGDNGDGSLKSITIDGKTYSGECITKTEKGNIKILDSDGKTIMVIELPENNKEGVTKFVKYNGDKKVGSIALDKDNKAKYRMEYDEDGKAKIKYFADSKNPKIREYSYDEKTGKLSSSTDYEYKDNKKGKELSKQEYGYDKVAGKTVWKKREFYDNNGEIDNSKTRTYDYEKDTNDCLTKIVTVGKDGNEVRIKYDKDGNYSERIKTKYTKNEEGKTIKTITNEKWQDGKWVVIEAKEIPVEST